MKQTHGKEVIRKMENEKNQPNPQATDPTQNNTQDNILLRIKTGYVQHTNPLAIMFLRWREG